ncbi:MAG: RNA methyltransferase [Cyclobacteriaceae bacterium]|nr:RNA methyltransferase [Cyclobacteriaceae bacterium]
MISKAKVKHLKALQVKKYRKEQQCFVIEGAKSVVELLQSEFEVAWVAGTASFITLNERLLQQKSPEWVVATEPELIAAGSFQTNDGAIAIARMKENNAPPAHQHNLILALDDIRDPGNLGTIIRTADWYGIQHIVASAETADVYNAKVLSATMGSFSRVNVFYTNLIEFISHYQGPVFGAFMDGEDVHEVKFPKGGLLVIGNEANGISSAVEKLITQKITIPRIGGAESLNAAIATGILLDVITQSKK